MYKTKKFPLSPEQFLPLLGRPMGAGYATDRIMVDGEPVGIMHREEPNIAIDSGWRFLAGDETQEYADDPHNWAIYDLNTIANCDRAIIPYLVADVGCDLDRVIGTDTFQSAE